MVQNFWREKSFWHINLKELQAASSTIMSLASPGDSVLLHVDNTVALSYLKKQGGKNLFKCVAETPSRLVFKKFSASKSKLGTFRAHARRSHIQMGLRRGGLYIKPKSFSRHFEKIFPRNYPRHRHVRQSGECKISKVLCEIPTLSSIQSECPKLLPPGPEGSLCQSPMENHFPLVEKNSRKQTFKMPLNLPILGFSHFLAPINKTQKVWDEMFGNSPSKGYVHKLSWPDYARTKMAPSLHSVIWQGLQSQKMPHADIKIYLAGLKSLKRYDLAFRRLFCIIQDMRPPNGTPL